MTRRAKWIAPAGEKRPNYTFLARKAFDLRSVPARAILRIAADSRYALYVNGEYVGAGPARGTHKRRFFDSYDVAGLLRAGRNSLAVEVHCPVTATYTTAPVAPGLCLEIEGIVATDESWQALPDPSRRADAPIYTMQTGFSDYRDLRKNLVGWERFKNAHAAWRPAREVAQSDWPGDRKLAARPVPYLTDDPSAPQAIVEAGSVPPHEERIEEDLDYAWLMREEAHDSRDATIPEGTSAELCDGASPGPGRHALAAPWRQNGARQ